MAGFLFGENAAKQIAKTVRYVRAIQQNDGKRGHKFRPTDTFREGIVGKTSTAITALSGSTPGSGSVTVYSFDGSTIASTSTDVTVYNNMTTAVDTGKWCQCKRVGAYLWIDVVDCL